jgi:hypothetical protein
MTQCGNLRKQDKESTNSFQMFVITRCSNDGDTPYAVLHCTTLYYVVVQLHKGLLYCRDHDIQ